MTVRSIGVSCIVAIVMVTSIAPSWALETNDARACRGFVERFYKWYAVDAVHGASSDHALKKKASDFSAELFRKLEEDSAAQAKVQGEIVGLDFDPFLATNAEPYPTYIVGKVFRKGKNYWAEIYGERDKKKTAKPIIWPEVGFNSGRWQFVNFHYVPDKFPVNENLLSILNQLKKDRDKPAEKTK